MATFFLQNTLILVGGTTLHSWLNKATLRCEVDTLDATTFAASHQIKLGGLKQTTCQVSGFWDSPTPDSRLFPALGTIDQPVTVAPQGGSTGVSYMFQAGQFEYEEFGDVGAVVPFSANLNGNNSIGLIRGQIATNNATVSATGPTGNVLTITGPTATQFLYAAIHVPIVGTTMTVIVESAPTGGFAAPTTRATFPAVTAIGGLFLARVPGPITDGFWRLNVSAITGTFNLYGSIGVQ